MFPGVSKGAKHLRPIDIWVWATLKIQSHSSLKAYIYSPGQNTARCPAHRGVKGWFLFSCKWKLQENKNQPAFVEAMQELTPSQPDPVQHAVALQALCHVKLSKSVASIANWGRSIEPAASSVFFTSISGNDLPLGNIVLLQWAVNGRKGTFYLIYVLCLMKYKDTSWTLCDWVL